MNIEGKLDEAVNALTRETYSYVRDRDGEGKFVVQAPLLMQLRVEITNSTGGAGGGSSSATAAIPLAAAALDLLEDIKAEVHDRWWQTHSLHHGYGRGRLVSELRTWAAAARADDAELKLAHKLCTGWVASIRGLLLPVRRWEIIGACPLCKATRCALSEDLGSPIYGTALVIEFVEGGAEGKCRACGEDFDPQVLAQMMRSA